MRTMFSVALIGADGAGKTTIARKLEQSFPLPVKYLYMGINIESSNVALPTSRFIEYLKRHREKKSGRAPSKGSSLHHQRHSSNNGQKNMKRKVGRSLWGGIRLANRLAEEWYRQALSWNYRRKGHIVVYDRHFQFDFELNGAEQESKNQKLSDSLHRWLLANVYPRPDLVIFLDAPAEVLYARKGEATLSYLDSRRQAFLRQGKQINNFIQIDSTQPLNLVYESVAAQIMRFHRLRSGAPKWKIWRKIIS